MNPQNNIFNGMNTNTGGSVFNGANNNPPQPPQPAQQQNRPASSNQPFFGFSSETGTNSQGVITPTQPITPIEPVNPSRTPKVKKQKTLKMPASPEQTIKRFTILSIILGVMVVVCLFLGIWGLIDATNMRTKLADTNAVLSTYSGIVKEIENQTGATINVVEDLPVYVPASDYVYITGWNIKLKIPATLTSVSYILNQNADYHSYICFAAMQEGVQYFPAFADINQNRDGVGCLYRIPVTDGEKDSNGNSYGQVVLTNGDYNYFYKEPARLYSASEADKGLETTARDLVKQMIVDGISTY